MTAYGMSVDPGLPSVAELVTHRRAMLLLDSVDVLEEDFIVTSLTVRADGLFDASGLLMEEDRFNEKGLLREKGRVPAWVGIEYMAQAMSALNGHRQLLRGKAVRLGFLAGTRRFHTRVSHFHCGELLQVSARRLLQTEEGLGSFDCVISSRPEAAVTDSSAAILCEARISAFCPDDPEKYYAQAGEAAGPT